MAKLTQILAVERATKNRIESFFTKIHQELLKTDLLNGFTKSYTATEENGEQLPRETKKVQFRAEDEIKKLRGALVELFDVTATKDATNCKAKADVVVDGQVLLKDVPAVHLLFLEAKLKDLATFAKKLPVLAQDENWHHDQAQSLWATDPVETIRTKKVMKHIVVVPASEHHPAQVKDDPEDVPVGRWSVIKYSGALTPNRAQAIQDRVEKLTKAVKYAREEANTQQTEKLQTGDAVMKFIFGE